MVKKIIYIFSVILLAGCFGGYSPESKFYRIQSVEDVAPVSRKNVSITPKPHMIQPHQ